jgi:GTP:adenosylcobinamide-phosphate guanylyltransferase
MLHCDAVLLAGRRDGQLDPLAGAAGVSHKCMVPVAGVPMLSRVLATLLAAPEIGRIAISIDDATVLADIISPHADRVFAAPAAPNLVDSVLAAASRLTPPLFVTTADNVLLTPRAIAEIVHGANGAGAAAAFARRGDVLAAHPDGQRRFYRFRDDAYSNCNAYVLGSGEALSAAEVFRGGGQFAKHPERILKAFGLWNLVSFRFGLRSLEEAFAGFGQRFGFPMRAVVVSDGRVAIDVDNERTLRIAEALLAA